MSFTTYTMVTTFDTLIQSSGHDYAAELEYGPAVSRNARIIYGQFVPYPLSVASLANYRTSSAMTSLLSGVGAALRTQIPNGSSTEIISLDFENWPFVYDFLDGSGQAAWPGTPTQYNDTAQAFWYGFIERARQVRPFCRWSLFDNPRSTYANYVTSQRSAHNNMGWMFSGPGSVDVITPSLYTPCQLIAGTADDDAGFATGGHTATRRNRWESQIKGEAERTAAGKDILYIAYTGVARSDIPAIDGQFLVDSDVSSYYQTAKSTSGCIGLAWWDAIGAVQRFNDLQVWIDDVLKDNAGAAGGCVLSFT